MTSSGHAHSSLDQAATLEVMTSEILVLTSPERAEDDEEDDDEDAVTSSHVAVTSSFVLQPGSSAVAVSDFR